MSDPVESLVIFVRNTMSVPVESLVIFVRNTVSVRVESLVIFVRNTVSVPVESLVIFVFSISCNNVCPDDGGSAFFRNIGLQDCSVWRSDCGKVIVSGPQIVGS
jgi:hypothetical protein